MGLLIVSQENTVFAMDLPNACHHTRTPSISGTLYETTIEEGSNCHDREHRNKWQSTKSFSRTITRMSSIFWGKLGTIYSQWKRRLLPASSPFLLLPPQRYYIWGYCIPDSELCRNRRDYVLLGDNIIGISESGCFLCEKGYQHITFSGVWGS